jgi:hypothetical protein
MLLLEVVLLITAKPFESPRAGWSVYFGMIIAWSEPPGRRPRRLLIAQLRHYSMFDQKTHPIRRALFAVRGRCGERLSPLPANG